MALTYPQYKNGRFPLSMMVKLVGSGGDNHYLPPATAARWYALQARAKARTGKTLLIWGGWDAYRPYAEQTRMRTQACAAGKCNGAALAGTSSHGLIFEGRDSAAFDAGNWGAVYGWDRAAFFADCRAVGLTPGHISPANGYPDEPWHVIDFNCWGPAPASGNATPFQEDAMTQADIDAINAHTTALFKNFLGVAGQGYTVPQVIAGDTSDIRARIRGPVSEPWDQIQRMRSILEGFANATTPKGVDVTAALREIEGRLAATFQAGLADVGAELKAQIVAGLAEGTVTRGDVEAAIDTALDSLQISRG